MLVGLRPVGRPALFSWSVADPDMPREWKWTWGRGIHPALKSQTSAPKDGPWFFCFLLPLQCCACSRKQFRGRETGEVAAAAVLRHQPRADRTYP